MKLARIWLISLQGARLEQRLAASKANERAMCIDGLTNGRAISRQIVVEMGQMNEIDCPPDVLSMRASGLRDEYLNVE